MRYDILNVGVEATRLEVLLATALKAEEEPDRYGPKTHLKASNGGWLRVRPALTNDAVSVVSLNSDLPDPEHNAWAVEVFNAAWTATDSDVELFDADDHVVHSRYVGSPLGATIPFIEAVESLAAAGVQLTESVANLRGGSTELAFTDAIALADEQQTALPAALVDDVRSLAARVLFRYPPAAAEPVNQALARIAARAVAAE